MSISQADNSSSDLFYFKSMDYKMALNPIGIDRTKIAEVRAEWKSQLPFLGVNIALNIYQFEKCWQEVETVNFWSR